MEARPPPAPRHLSPPQGGPTDAMEVDNYTATPSSLTLVKKADKGKQPEQATSSLFIPYKSSLHRTEKNIPLSMVWDTDSSSDDEEENIKEHNAQIKVALNVMIHPNHQGSQSLTSGWEYYQAYPPISAMVAQSLNQSSKNLPTPVTTEESIASASINLSAGPPTGDPPSSTTPTTSAPLPNALTPTKSANVISTCPMDDGGDVVMGNLNDAALKLAMSIPLLPDNDKL
ncbi:hypothetical protein F5146DRAFT_1141940 [Armillaria mellea]|nr:hypothetical protein F5146DRAFT_1141940 [Armillaria mellea]